MLAYVLSETGRPLMPTKRMGHIKRLLDKGLARIVSKVPYVVQLKYETPGITQPLHGGMDPGRTNIGMAVIDDVGDVVYKAHVETRNREVPKLMAERKQHRQMSRRGERLRRRRRARKNGTTKEFPNGRMVPGCTEPVMLKDITNTEAKFRNRKRPEGWITPTVRQLVQTHASAAQEARSILPITDWCLEYNRFAFMKMDDGTIKGADFKNGRMKGYKDSHEYIYAIQDGKCYFCGDGIGHVHHIVPRSKGGSDTPENLVGLCPGCHGKVHAHELSLDRIGLKKKYGALSVLNQAMPYIAGQMEAIFGEGNAPLSFGWETAYARDGVGMEKDHPEDAACIAAIGAGITDIKDDIGAFELEQFRRHDRQIIKAQKERTYLLDGKAVCKNRNKRTDQGADSLREFRMARPKDVGRLKVKKSKRSRNKAGRLMPGAVVMYAGERHVVKGNHNDRYVLFGIEGNGVPRSKCTVLKYNTGLVYM